MSTQQDRSLATWLIDLDGYWGRHFKLLRHSCDYQGTQSCIHEVQVSRAECCPSPWSALRAYAWINLATLILCQTLRGGFHCHIDLQPLLPLVNTAAPDCALPPCDLKSDLAKRVLHYIPGLAIPSSLLCSYATEGTPASANLISATALAIQKARWMSIRRNDASHANCAERTRLNANASSRRTFDACGAHLPM